jgi:hypothetical protein
MTGEVATAKEIKIVNDFVNLIFQRDKQSKRLKKEIRATLWGTFREVQELKEFLDIKQQR